MNWNITAGRPVYVQLVEQLELALVAGEFPPGSRNPPECQRCRKSAENQTLTVRL